ncbi:MULTISPECIES: glycolate oxidase subunit GlcF [Rhodomicrobium]|uniref:glycolate oxidase subunit GlcF n=1 Tax=Rhodomicrobium TaxID=1068 RepID=UPI000B4B0B5C|nr:MULTISPECIES: glycolate oxidase subunit GlcF [Rhodomicrobium]
METHFSTRQLTDPATKEAEEILRRCVHCGFCTATCSTYVLLGDERDSPRGRIYLIKDMLENDRKASPEVRFHVDRCLSCLSCVTTCPSGVDYMHLVDYARVRIEKTASRPLKDRLMRRLIQTILPFPGRMRSALLLAAIAKPFKSLFHAVGLKELAAMVGMAPTMVPKRVNFPGPKIYFGRQGARRARVALLSGCAQQVLRPQINDAAIRLLVSQGVEVVLAKREGCCGALVHHMGREEEARDFARRNIDAWEEAMKEAPLDAILVTASGCGTTIKDYGHMLAHDPVYAERAKRISALARDITEFLADVIDIGAPSGWSDIRVAYHSACSMQHGQRVNDQPRRLLREAGFSVAEVGEGHICCGSAGTYNILQPELASELRERKLGNIAATKPDCVATGNIGCITQLAGRDASPIVHTVELLDWAYGGTCPSELAHLAGRMRLMSAEFGKRSA